ncbi:MAG: metal-dependent transcriptional regulator [Sedimentisphaerales bacterium]|nr:metal-dependent transcriptional regulator [Sedimentisphaerales bacterium]
MAGMKKTKLSASLEDYLEAIYNLAGDSNITRSRDIAGQLGVSRASVTGALRALKDKNLVHYKPYNYISLTESGRIAAAEIANKHDILKSFFIDVLGEKSAIAQSAACKAEHALGPEIIARLLSFIEFVNHNSENGRNLVEEFRKFCGTKRNKRKVEK